MDALRVIALQFSVTVTGRHVRLYSKKMTARDPDLPDDVRKIEVGFPIFKLPLVSSD